MINEVPSLYLSENHPPDQVINRLETHNFTLRQFIGLKSFLLSYVSQKQLMSRVMLALRNLNNLTRLTIRRCSWCDDWKSLPSALPFID